MQSAPDLFSLYYRLYERTEPPIIFHRWSYITCLSAYLGRQLWLPFGSNRIFPNFYTMLIGHPGSRKSTAIKLGKKLFSSAGYTTYAAEKTSKEKFLLDLEGLTVDDINETLPSGRRSKNMKGLTSEDILENLFGKENKNDRIRDPREVFIVADEFNEFAGSGNLEFLSLLGMLWDWDDTELDYQFRLKNSKSVSIYQPTVSILSGNTHAGFVEAFPPQAIGQGFLSRLILVYGEPSGRKITFPEPPNESLRAEFISRIIEIKKVMLGPLSLSKDAEQAIDTIYKSWNDLEDGRFKHYSNRRLTHLLKLLIVLTASRCSLVITEYDVVYANSILSWTERDMPKALGEFGKSKDSEISSKIMAALYETKMPLAGTSLLKIVGKDINKQTDLGEIMQKLINSGQAQYVKEGNVSGYLPRRATLNTKQAFVNFPMLKEYQAIYGKG